MTTDQTRDPRADLLDAIDSTYAYGVLGYDTPEALLAAYDATLSVPPSADRATLDEVRKLVRRLAAHAEGFGDVLDDSDRDPWAKTVRADIAALVESMNQAADDERPLSPDYEHPECGFHWHGRDGMDIPVRDGQPVCPRCELAKVEKKLAYVQRMRDEVGEECKRRHADALLALLPASLPSVVVSADRATLLREAADHLARQADELWMPGTKAHTVMHADADELRRLADGPSRVAAEEQPTETQDGDCPSCEAGIPHVAHCPTPESHNWGCGCPGDKIRLYADRGVGTPGCDCGHDGMGVRWHREWCDWVAALTAEARALLAAEERPAVAEQPDTQTREAVDPTQCSGDEGFCPEHGFHRHSLKQPGTP